MTSERANNNAAQAYLIRSRLRTAKKGREKGYQGGAYARTKIRGGVAPLRQKERAEKIKSLKSPAIEAGQTKATMSKYAIAAKILSSYLESERAALMGGKDAIAAPFPADRVAVSALRRVGSESLIARLGMLPRALVKPQLRAWRKALGQAIPALTAEEIRRHDWLVYILVNAGEQAARKAYYFAIVAPKLGRQVEDRAE